MIHACAFLTEGRNTAVDFVSILVVILVFSNIGNDQKLTSIYWYLHTLLDGPVFPWLGQVSS